MRMNDFRKAATLYAAKYGYNSTLNDVIHEYSGSVQDKKNKGVIPGIVKNLIIDIGKCAELKNIAAFNPTIHYGNSIYVQDLNPHTLFANPPVHTNITNKTYFGITFKLVHNDSAITIWEPGNPGNVITLFNSANIKSAIGMGAIDYTSNYFDSPTNTKKEEKN